MMRSIRSFVPRQGRMTIAQKSAFDAHARMYLLSVPMIYADPFLVDKPLVLDIGFGMGDALWQMAQAHPEYHFLGAEVHRPGIGALFRQVETLGLTNVRVIEGDVNDFLAGIKHPLLHRVNIYFPDPWQKKRHHKRRLIQTGFVDKLSSLMVAHGTLHIATDWADYAEHIQSVMSEREDFSPLLNDAVIRPETKFERRGKRLGHKITDFRYQHLKTK